MENSAEALQHSRAIYAFTRLGIDIEIAPADPSRLWMHQTDHNFANRCLPLRMANQAGWFIYTSTTVEASWNGGDLPHDLTISTTHDPTGRDDIEVLSHFGYGIATWTLPVLFRTPPGIQLLVRGPANWIIDGASPLEGIVETDWTAAPFTMNWKLTRAGSVRFESGSPICMIMPIRLDLIEELQPSYKEIMQDHQIARAYARWSDERSILNERKRSGSSPAAEWSKEYFFGRNPYGDAAQHHRTRLQVKHFGWDD